jgi:hypothetical protein
MWSIGRSRIVETWFSTESAKKIHTAAAVGSTATTSTSRRPAGVLERIPETPSILHVAVSDMLIPDPTENLIIHSILDHAGRFPGTAKALLTDNRTDFTRRMPLAVLATVGIRKPFRVVVNVVGWFGSL